MRIECSHSSIPSSSFALANSKIAVRVARRKPRRFSAGNHRYEIRRGAKSGHTSLVGNKNFGRNRDDSLFRVLWAYRSVIF